MNTLQAIRTYAQRNGDSGSAEDIAQLMEDDRDRAAYQREATERLIVQHERRGLVAAPTSTPAPMPSTTRPIQRRMATPPQVGYVRTLLGRLATHNPEVYAVAVAYVEKLGAGMTFEQAGRTIDRLKANLAAPAVPGLTLARDAIKSRSLAGALADVDEGRYAVGTEAEARFYQVKISQHGNKYMMIGHANGAGVGWTFLPVEKGAIAAAEKIAADPKQAMLNFGHWLGECGNCGRALTNDESRAAGIGPICRAKLGW